MIDDFLKKLLFLVLLLFAGNTKAQDSCNLRISLLTCSPGDELYSTFGHSALRVVDSTGYTDLVYNYGTFSFEEPGFYTKFIRGKLLYYLSTEDFPSFRDMYKEDKRGMIEQVLNLTCSEKLKMVNLLYKNLEPANKYYKYDFLFDNCTTRLRDLLEMSAAIPVKYNEVIKKTSFRQLIHIYLDKNEKMWGKFGIDLLLGSRTDIVMNTRQVMFLPDYLMYSFDTGRVGDKRIVHSKERPYVLPEQPAAKDFFTSPLFIFSLPLLLILVLSRSEHTFIRRLILSFDGLFFFTTGIAGMLILFMWFGTEHAMCRDNYNIIWAFPFHAVAAFFIQSRQTWVYRYFLITGVVNIAFLILWFLIPQGLNISFLPLILLLIYRSFSHYYNLHSRA